MYQADALWPFISLNPSGSSPQSHRIHSIIMLLNLYKYNEIGSTSGNKATNEGTIAEAQDISLSPTETGSGHRKTQVMEMRAINPPNRYNQVLFRSPKTGGFAGGVHRGVGWGAGMSWGEERHEHTIRALLSYPWVRENPPPPPNASVWGRLLEFSLVGSIRCISFLHLPACSLNVPSGVQE